MKFLKKRIILMNFLFLFLLGSIGLCSNVDRESLSRKELLKNRFEKREKQLEAIYQDLNLSEEQKNNLRENKLKHREKMKELIQQKRQYRQQLKQELSKEDLDMPEIQDIHQKSKTVQSKIIDNRLDSILEVRKTLTPEQFNKIMDVIEPDRSFNWTEESSNSSSKELNEPND